MSKIKKSMTAAVLSAGLMATGIGAASADTKIWDRGPFDRATCLEVQSNEEAANADNPDINVGGCWEHPGIQGSFYFSVWVRD